MRALHAIERRLQDMERKFQNKERLGRIVDVKFESQRWFVKMNDGEDQTPSGSGGQGGSGRTFKSDWMPWKSFSHGTIKMSVPPKKGMQVLMRSVAGMPELATVEPHHYGPDTPSPHGKEDEVVKLIEDEDQQNGGQDGEGGGAEAGGESGGEEGGDKKWNHWLRETKDTHHLIIRKKDDQQQDDSQDQTSPEAGGGGGGELDAMNSKGGQRKQKSRKIPEVEEDGDDDTTQVKSTKEYILKTVGKKKSYYRQDGEKVHIRYGDQDEKADILMDENQVKIQFKDKKAMVKWTEEDLTVQFGEDENAKMVMTDEDITITQGGEDASKIFITDHEIVVSQGDDASRVTIQEDYVEVKGATECSCGVDGRWVYINQGRVNLGVSGPKEMADKRVMTEAGPSQVVWAKIG